MQKPAELADLPSDFLAFYQNFHVDSAYQMAHIEWPLKGEKTVRGEDEKPKKVLATWEPENWTMLHSPDLNDVGLKRSFETISGVLIIERLQYPTQRSDPSICQKRTRLSAIGRPPAAA